MVYAHVHSIWALLEREHLLHLPGGYYGIAIHSTRPYIHVHVHTVHVYVHALKATIIELVQRKYYVTYVHVWTLSVKHIPCSKHGCASTCMCLHRKITGYGTSILVCKFIFLVTPNGGSRPQFGPCDQLIDDLRVA